MRELFYAAVGHRTIFYSLEKPKQRMQETLTSEHVRELRAQHYNGTVVDLRMVHDELMILRVRPDERIPSYKPGQYTVLGMGNWERRTSRTQAENLAPEHLDKLVKRAYSISSPMMIDDQLVDASEVDYLEFYIALIREALEKAPALTPRLFALKRGDRLFVGPKITGHYTLEGVGDDDDVVFFSTGTGEAPHNAMSVELLRRGHRGKIVNAVCVRFQSDLAYADIHAKIAEKYPNYKYLSMTTREPWNLDEKHPDYVGKVYLQDFITSGGLETALGHPILPKKTHVFLCGNPSMIGVPEAQNGERIYPRPIGVIEILERQGFTADETGRSGNVHFEKYW